jgi:2',3'-cyclic-nucleotide 2'-phosphodiesterase (5'-nucleotidase family)
VKTIKYFFPFVFLLFYQCRLQTTLTDYQTKNIQLNRDSSNLTNELTQKTIAPYKAKLDSLMNEVLCENNQDLIKELPEGTLGNFVCDEIYEYATNKLNIKADFCIYNYGGIRISNLPKGKITIGKIYELCPFENTLVLVELKGNYCIELFDLIAKNNGTPCSRQLNLKLNKQQIQEVLLNKQVLDTNQSYFILTNDYVANGGDKTEPMKKATSKKELNIKIRDLLISSLQERGKFNNAIKVEKDGRITQNQ